MIFRLRYKKLGGHIHCRLFEAQDHTKTFAKNGDLVFDENSWKEFLAQTGRTAIEVIPEEVEGTRFSWTQPICAACYQEREDRAPANLIDAEIEKCCVCGLSTQSGIYYRIDPLTIMFPTRVK